MLRAKHTASGLNNTNHKRDDDTLETAKGVGIVGNNHPGALKRAAIEDYSSQFSICDLFVHRLIQMKNKNKVNRRYLVGIIILFLATASSIVSLSEFDSSTFHQKELYSGRLFDSPQARSAVVKSKMAVMESMPSDEATELSATSFVTDGGASTPTLGQEYIASLNNELSFPQEETNKIDKMLVHEGSLTIRAPKKDVENLADQIVSLTEDGKKGYVENRSTNNDYHYGAESSRLNVQLSLRVLSSEFHSIIAAIKNIVRASRMVEITSSSTSSRDVTDQYIDVTSRAETLRSSRKAMTALLEKATNVKEILSVQAELNKLTQDYESKKSRAAYLKKQADFSHLFVTLEEKSENESTKKGNLWSPLESFWSALMHLNYAAVFGANMFIYAAVWAIPVVAISCGISFFFRR